MNALKFLGGHFSESKPHFVKAVMSELNKAVDGDAEMKKYPKVSRRARPLRSLRGCFSNMYCGEHPYLFFWTLSPFYQVFSLSRVSVLHLCSA